jgi:hypothetical protein
MELTREFNSLKERIFRGSSFIDVDLNNPDFQRYSELAGIIYGLNRRRLNDV